MYIYVYVDICIYIDINIYMCVCASYAKCQKICAVYVYPTNSKIAILLGEIPSSTESAQRPWDTRLEPATKKHKTSPRPKGKKSCSASLRCFPKKRTHLNL